MTLLEVLVHRGCMPEQAACDLAKELRVEDPTWQVDIVDDPGWAQELGICILPPFVLNGTLLAVGFPRKEWLRAKVREVERAKEA